MLVVLGVLLAMASQFGAAIAVTGSTGLWAQRLQPRPPAATTVPLPRPTVDPLQPTTPAASPRPMPEQSVGPVEVTDDVKRGVVLISGRTPNEGVAGTGMVLSEDGYVLTNYHVVRSTESITVTIASSGRRYNAEMVGRDATKDVALLKLERARNLESVTIDGEDVRLGDVVVAAGNANGQGFVTAHRGNVLGLGRSINVRGASENDPPQRLNGLIETNAPAWPGDSGGPMFDGEGEVLGMTTAGSSASDAAGGEDKQVYAVPIHEALAVVEKIRGGDESGTVVIGPKAYLGVIAEVDDSSGLRVRNVLEDSPAGRTGLREGDTILSLDGRRVRTRAELSDVLDTIEPDTTTTISWATSAGRERTAQITVAANPLN